MLNRLRDWLRSVGGRLGGFEFEIRHDPRSGTKVRGAIPTGKIGGIAEFFRRDLQPSGLVMVRGSRKAGSTLEMRITGPIAAGDRQRIRNFLLGHLA